MTDADRDPPPPPEGYDPITEEPVSPLLSTIGARLTRWEDGFAEVVLDVGASVINRQNVVHGGAVMTLIDGASGYAGCYCPYPGRVRHALTLSMTTNFMAPGRAPCLITTSRVVGGGRGTFFTQTDVCDIEGQLVARSSGVFRRRSDSLTLYGAPRPPSA